MEAQYKCLKILKIKIITLLYLYPPSVGDDNYLPWQLISGTEIISVPRRTPDKGCFTQNAKPLLKKTA